MAQKNGSSIKKAILYVLFALFTVLLVVLEILNMRYGRESALSEMIYSASTRSVGAAVCMLLAFYCSYGSIFRFNTDGALKGFLLSLPCFLVVLNNFPILAYIRGEAVVSSPAYMVALYAFQCFAVGVFEETAFRGCIFMMFLQKRHSNRKEIFFSVVASSAVFGAIHLVNLLAGSSIVPVIMQVGYSFLIGSMCATVLLLTGNIWTGIILHAAFNFCGGIVPALGSGEIWNTPTVIFTAVLAVCVTVYMIVVFCFNAEKCAKRITDAIA